MKKFNFLLVGLVICTIIPETTFCQLPGNLPINLQNIPPGLIPSGLPSSSSTNISTDATISRDQTSNRQYVTDLRIKAREDSIRLLRERANAMKANDTDKLLIFGSEIFANKSLDFNARLNIPTPSGYILGPDDQLIINLFGSELKDVTIERRIGSDGKIILEMVGPIYLSGLTIEEATKLIKEKLSVRYLPLRAGIMQMKVRLGDIRSIQVNFIGEVVNPGTYTLPSLATLMNALYLSGGPTNAGSFRNINLIRRDEDGKDKVIASVDLYQYLTKGLRINDISLRYDDVVQIPPYKTRIEIANGVKKAGIFEILPGEKLSDLIDFAGGFQERAYQEIITVRRLSSKGTSFIDVKKSEFSSFELQNGDGITIKNIPERDENVVKISGQVYLPGEYPLDRNASLKALIERAEGIKKEAFSGRIAIYRLKNDMTTEIIPVNLFELNKNPASDIQLTPLDSVVVVSVKQLRDNKLVKISGEVKNPNFEANDGYFLWYEGMTVEDLILLAGSLEASASPNRVEVIRPKMLTTDDPSLINSTIAETITFPISKDLRLTSEASRFKLLPFDEVFIRASPNFEQNQIVKIEGQILYPGYYGLIDRDERISDVITRAGGINKYGYVEGATIIRTTKLSDSEVRQQQVAISEISDDTKNAAVKPVDVSNNLVESIGIDLAYILKNPKSEQDLILQEGDVINIPKFTPTVRVLGEVQLPTTTRFTEGVGLNEYISRAGGFTAKAVRKRAYVIYANGFVKKTRRFLIFNSYPEIQPGSRVIVPTRTKADVTSQQVISSIAQIGTALSGVIGVVALIQSLRRL